MKCPYCKEEILDDAIKCKHCGSILNDENEVNEHGESFLQRLFNWKYLLFVVFVTLVVVGLDLNNQNSDFVFALLFITPIILAVKSKKKKILLFIASLFLYMILFVSIGLALIYKDRVNTKKEENHLVEKYIDKLLESNNQLPNKENEYLTLTKIEKEDSNTVNLIYKIEDFTKDAILLEFGYSSTNDFYNDFLTASCTHANDKLLYKAGLVQNMILYDKDNKLIDNYALNNNACQPYYKENISTSKSWSKDEIAFLEETVKAPGMLGIGECQRKLIIDKYSGVQFKEGILGYKEIQLDAITNECLMELASKK